MSASLRFGREFRFHLETGVHFILTVVSISFGKWRSFHLDTFFNFSWKQRSILIGHRIPKTLNPGLHFICKSASILYGRRFAFHLITGVNFIWTPVSKRFGRWFETLFDLDTGFEKHCPVGSQPFARQVAEVIENPPLIWNCRPNIFSPTPPAPCFPLRPLANLCAALSRIYRTMDV